MPQIPQSPTPTSGPRHDETLSDRLRSDSLLQTIGMTIPLGVWVSDAEGQPTYVSQSFLDLIGMKMEDYRALRWCELVHPEDREATNLAWKNCIRAGTFWNHEFRLSSHDGKVVHVLSRGAPIRDANGAVIGWTGVTLDISDHSSSRDRMRQSEELYRGVVDMASEGIWRTDASGYTQLVNTRLGEMLGACPNQLRNGAIQDFVSPLSKIEFDERWSRLKSGERQKFDCCFQAPGAEALWAQVSASATRNAAGEFEGALFLLTDISARRAAEEYLLKAK
ncbi:MAG: PAS domain-containing protein, partial [Bdellovibrionaceae bacterium]|nr:PAS domain-containing protein [Pseudobdellovibrionaceae bacterium]